MGVYVDRLYHNVLIPENRECLEAINDKLSEQSPDKWEPFTSVQDAFSAAGWDVFLQPHAGVEIAGCDRWDDDMLHVFTAAAPWVVPKSDDQPATLEFSLEGDHFCWLFANGAMFEAVGRITYGDYKRLT